MIEKETVEPVAYQYRWKLDGEWTNWRVSDASQESPWLKDIQERPLYATPPIPPVEAIREENRTLRSALERVQYAQQTNHGCMATILHDIAGIASAALSAQPAANAAEAHERGIEPRAGSFGVDWHEEWMKMRLRYRDLKKLSEYVVSETDRIHDNEPWPVKYRAPYEAIAKLRAALSAKETSND